LRLDKFLCEMNIGTRSQVKELIRKKQIKVNGQIALKPELQIDEKNDEIIYQSQKLSYSKYVYFMMNKPKGVVSATTDNVSKTVLDLMDYERKQDLFPVGRLDKDTEGLLLLTNDGELAHRLLAPKKHVEKTYLVTIQAPLRNEDIALLEKGVDIGEEKPTLPAKVKVIDDYHMELTIHEGKFHQVKRMLQAVNNLVVELKRIQFGALTLDEKLIPGAYRELTETEQGWLINGGK